MFCKCLRICSYNGNVDIMVRFYLIKCNYDVMNNK